MPSYSEMTAPPGRRLGLRRCPLLLHPMLHLVLAATLFAAATAPLPPQDAQPAPLAAHFPANTGLYLELQDPAALLDRALLDAYLDRLEAAALLEPLHRIRAEGALKFTGMLIGGDPLELGAQLLSGGLAIAVVPTANPEQPNFALALRGDDPELLDRLLGVLLQQVSGARDPGTLLDVPHATVHGHDVWRFEADLNPRVEQPLYLARRGAAFFAASSNALFEGLLAPAADGGLAAQATFALPAGSDLAVWTDMDYLEAIGDDPEEIRYLRKLPALPEAQFLMGATLAELGTCAGLALGLELSADGVGAELLGTAPAVRTGLAPAAAPLAPRLRTAAAMASAQLHRDFDGIIAARNELFAPEAQPGFAKALSELGVLIGGLDLEEDLLPGIGPWVEIGVAPLDYANAPVPDVALPGVVALFEVAPEVQRNLLASFQTTLSISNAERAQNGQPPFVLLLSLDGETQISAGHMPPPREPNAPVDTAYNLAPAAALFEGFFVVGTHEAAVRAALADLRATSSSTGERAAGLATERLVIAVPPLRSLVDANHDALVMQAILEEGKSREEATTELDSLVAALGMVESLNAEVRDRREGAEAGTIALAFELTWTPSPTSAPEAE